MHQNFIYIYFFSYGNAANYVDIYVLLALCAHTVIEATYFINVKLIVCINCIHSVFEIKKMNTESCMNTRLLAHTRTN